MADPMFDNLEKVILGACTPEEIDSWIGGNLVLTDYKGWNSDNLKLCAWFCDLRAAMQRGHTSRLERLRGLIRQRCEWERDGNYGGIEQFGRVYAEWNYVVRLCLFRFARVLGWEDEAALLRGWLRSHAVMLALASGGGAGREITDHLIARGEAHLGSAIIGAGRELPWWDPFLAWSGDRGAQRVGTPGAEYGRWQHLQESPLAPVLCELLRLYTDTRRQTWMDFWGWSRALDQVAPYADAPLGVSAIEIETLHLARAGVGHAVHTVAGWLWRPSTPHRVCRTDEGVWMVSEVARGSSTAHLDACAWWADGSTGFLCADPGWREPGGQGYVRTGSAWVDGGRAYATREGRETVSMPLPGGEVLVDLRIGSSGAEVFAPRPAPRPVPPAPRAPGGPSHVGSGGRKVGLIGLIGLLLALFSRKGDKD